MEVKIDKDWRKKQKSLKGEMWAAQFLNAGGDIDDDEEKEREKHGTATERICTSNIIPGYIYLMKTANKTNV